MEKKNAVETIRRNLILYEKLILTSTGDVLKPQRIPKGTYISLLLGTSVLKQHVLYLIEQLREKLGLFEKKEENIPTVSGIEILYGMIIGHIHALGLRSYDELIADGKK